MSEEKKKIKEDKKINTKIAELEKQIEEYKSGWQRAQADYKNLQAEIDKKKSEWVKMSELQVLSDFMPVYDNFKKAFSHHPELDVENENDKRIMQTDAHNYLFVDASQTCRSNFIVQDY